MLEEISVLLFLNSLGGMIAEAGFHRAAGPPTNTSYRSDGDGLLPLVAHLCDKVNNLWR